MVRTWETYVQYVCVPCAVPSTHRESVTPPWPRSHWASRPQVSMCSHWFGDVHAYAAAARPFARQEISRVELVMHRCARPAQGESWTPPRRRARMVLLPLPSMESTCHARAFCHWCCGARLLNLASPSHARGSALGHARHSPGRAGRRPPGRALRFYEHWNMS